MLIEETLFGTVDKVKIAIERLQEHEPQEGYYVCFSGGKDSTVMYDLVKKSGVKYDVHYNTTTIEPPDLLDFVKKNYPEVEMIPPKNTMFDLVVKKGYPPTQKFRYCTTELKQVCGKGRFKVTGIRAEESAQRARKKIVEVDRNGTKNLNVIHDWTEKEIWQYIRENNLPYCKLYDEGYSRIGCVLCPFAKQSTIQQDLKNFSSIVQMYKDACDEAYKRRLERGKAFKYFHSGEDIFNWWFGILLRKNQKIKPDENLISLFEE